MAYRRRMAHVMHIMSLCIRPKRVHKQIILIFAKDFACHGSHEYSKESLQRSGPGHFGVTLGWFWDDFAHSWATLRSFWVYEVYFEVTLVHSQKTFIFPIDFNDFI